MRVERFATSKTLTGSGVRRRAPQRKTLRSAASPRARGVVFSSRLFAAPLREKSVNKKLLKKQKPLLNFCARKNRTFCKRTQFAANLRLLRER